jgi:hypothetical protein
MTSRKEPPERITGWWNYHGHVLVKTPSMDFYSVAYIRQDIVKELAKTLVDICNNISIQDLSILTNLSIERCCDINEIAITYMED